MTDPNFLLAQLAQALGNRPRQQFQPMWAEDQMRGLRPGFQNGYDYWSALKYGVRRQPFADGHMSSLAPQNGLVLKSENHPTFGLTREWEERIGNELYRGKDGRLYSRPKRKK